MEREPAMRPGGREGGALSRGRLGISSTQPGQER